MSKSFFIAIVLVFCSISVTAQTKRDQEKNKNHLSEFDPNATEWQIKIKVVANNGSSLDTLAAFGANNNATDGYDAGFDVPSAPFPSGIATQVYFNKNENFENPFGSRFSKDIRAFKPFDSGVQDWFPVVNTTDAGQFEISIEIPINFPSRIIFSELDSDFSTSKGAGETLYLSYNFTEGGEKKFHIRIGDSQAPTIEEFSHNLFENTIEIAGEEHTFQYRVIDESGISSVNAFFTVTTFDGLEDEPIGPIALTNMDNVWTVKWLSTTIQTAFKQVQIRIEAIDFAMNKEVQINEELFVIVSKQQKLEVSEGLQLIGLPFNASLSKNSIFESTPSNTFSFFDWNGLGFETNDVINTGKGFFLNATQSTIKEISSEVATTPIRLPISQGWHLVSSPMILPLSLDEITFVDKSDNTLYTHSEAVSAKIVVEFTQYNQQDFTNEIAAEIQPFLGYWFGVLKANIDIIWNPSFSVFQKGDAKIQKEKNISANINALNLTATDASGYKSKVTFGYSPEATNEIDPGFDRISPPTHPNGMSLSLVGPTTTLGNHFSRLIYQGDEIKDISLALNGNATNNEVTLSWEEGSLVGKTNLVINGVSFDLTKAGSVKITPDSEIEVKLNPILTSLEENEIDFSFRLDQNYPNPFNPSTTINFEIPKTANVKLTVFNLLGQEVASIVNTKLAAGMYSKTLDASQLSSGTYFYKLEVDNFTQIKKMSLIK